MTRPLQISRTVVDRLPSTLNLILQNQTAERELLALAALRHFVSNRWEDPQSPVGNLAGKETYLQSQDSPRTRCLSVGVFRPNVLVWRKY
jgi:hypothetical protein